MHDLRAYAIEAAATGTILAAAGMYTLAVQHPGSPLHGLLPDAFARRGAVGLAMGSTVAAIVYSPWGRRSGAHCNPAVTLAFFRLRKVAPLDAIAYVAAQFAGAFLGVLIVAAFFRALLGDPSVHWYVTVPGMAGAAAAFLAEFGVTALLMTVVLRTMASQRARPYTGLCAALTLALAIAFESPLSGTGLNPAHSIATAAVSGIWTAWWIYLTAPPFGMLFAAELHARFARRPIPCAKLAHDRGRPCQFLNCAFSGATV